MSKVTLENIEGKITIINKLSYPESVNERVYNDIASGVFEGFVPVSISQKRKETIIECVVQGLIPLTQYFDGIVTKKMFLDFVHEIALQIKNCEKHLLSANNLDLQSDKIFVDPRSGRVKCIFWPVVNNQRGTPPHLFLKQLPIGLNFDSNENNDYLGKYNAFLGGITPFSVNAFDRMILELLGNNNAESHKTSLDELSSEKHNNSKNVIEYDPFADNSVEEDEPKTDTENNRECSFVFCPFCGVKNEFASKFCGGCGKNIKREESAKQVVSDDSVDIGTLLSDKDAEGTIILAYNSTKKQVFPTLTRLKNEETYSVNRPLFRIGKNVQSCDLVISDNKYISRLHAEIIIRDNRYYIVDKNSTNNTFVDGEIIPPEQEVEIFAGTKIQLADEDFVFDIKS